MARHKDENWSLPDGRLTDTGGFSHEWVSIHAALLMDIRGDAAEADAREAYHRELENW